MKHDLLRREALAFGGGNLVDHSAELQPAVISVLEHTDLVASHNKGSVNLAADCELAVDVAVLVQTFRLILVLVAVEVGSRWTVDGIFKLLFLFVLLFLTLLPLPRQSSVPPSNSAIRLIIW